MAKIKKDAFGNIIPTQLIPDTIPNPITPAVNPTVLPQNQTATQTNTTIPTPLTPDQNAQINQDISKTMSTLPANPTIDEGTLAGRLALSGVAPKQGSMGMPSSLSQQVKEIYATQTNPQLIENMLRNVLTQEQQGIKTQQQNDEDRFSQLAQTKDGRATLIQEAQAKTGFFQYFTSDNPQQDMIKKLAATPLNEAPPDVYSKENLEIALKSVGMMEATTFAPQILSSLQLVKQSIMGSLTKQGISETSTGSKALRKLVGYGGAGFGIGRISNMPQKILSDSESVISDSEKQSNDVIDLVKSGEYTGTEGLIQLDNIQGTINDTERTIKATNKADLKFWLNGGKDTAVKILNSRDNIKIKKDLLLNLIATGQVKG